MNNIQSIFQKHAPAYIESHNLSIQQLKAISSISFCKTPQMGSHLLSCDKCGHQKIVHNSCGNRHCPSCGFLAKEMWLHKQQQSLLPIHYFHLVFTLPDNLRPLIFANQKLLYDLMYDSVSKTITQASQKNLSTTPGFSLILHTWGQNLMFHPHLHCILPGGGLSSDNTHFKTFKKKFFVHVKKLSIIFRGKFLDALKKLYSENKLKLFGSLNDLNNKFAFQSLIDNLYNKNWIVFSKPVFKCASSVLKYLGRYTHRVAISDHRIVNVTDSSVSFKYKDNKDGGKEKIMTLATSEFIRRFLLHILPHKFVKIRHYGFLSNRVKSTKIALCRKLIQKQKGIVLSFDYSPFNIQATLIALIGKEKICCPVCGNFYTYHPNALCVNIC